MSANIKKSFNANSNLNVNLSSVESNNSYSSNSINNDIVINRKNKSDDECNIQIPKNLNIIKSSFKNNIKSNKKLRIKEISNKNINNKINLKGNTVNLIKLNNKTNYNLKKNKNLNYIKNYNKNYKNDTQYNSIDAKYKQNINNKNSNSPNIAKNKIYFNEINNKIKDSKPILTNKNKLSTHNNQNNKNTYLKQLLNSNYLNQIIRIKNNKYYSSNNSNVVVISENESIKQSKDLSKNINDIKYLGKKGSDKILSKSNTSSKSIDINMCNSKTTYDYDYANELITLKDFFKNRTKEITRCLSLNNLNNNKVYAKYTGLSISENSDIKLNKNKSTNIINCNINNKKFNTEYVNTSNNTLKNFYNKHGYLYKKDNNNELSISSNSDDLEDNSYNNTNFAKYTNNFNSTINQKRRLTYLNYRSSVSNANNSKRQSAAEFKTLQSAVKKSYDNSSYKIQNKKIKIIEYILAVLAFLNIIFSIIDTQLYIDRFNQFRIEKQNNTFKKIIKIEEENLSFAENVIRFIIMIICIVMAVLIYIKHNIMLDLKVIDGRFTNKDNLISSGMYKTFIIELIISSVFYPPFLKSIIISESNEYQFIIIVNAVICLITLFKFYHIIRIYKYTSKFLDFNAYSICNKYFSKADFLFAFKAELKSRPFLALSIVFLLFLLLMSFSLRTFENGVFISERYLIDNNYDVETTDAFSISTRKIPTKGTQKLDYIANSLWFIIVTVTTVGYGDAYPKTHLGRIVTSISCIFGMFLVSLITASLNRYTEFSSEEKKAYLTLKQLQMEKEVNRKAAEVIKIILMINKSIKIKMHDSQKKPFSNNNVNINNDNTINNNINKRLKSKHISNFDINNKANNKSKYNINDDKVSIVSKHFALFAHLKMKISNFKFQHKASQKIVPLEELLTKMRKKLNHDIKRLMINSFELQDVNNSINKLKHKHLSNDKKISKVIEKQVEIVKYLVNINNSKYTENIQNMMHPSILKEFMKRKNDSSNDNNFTCNYISRLKAPRNDLFKKTILNNNNNNVVKTSNAVLNNNSYKKFGARRSSCYETGVLGEKRISFLFNNNTVGASDINLYSYDKMNSNNIIDNNNIDFYSNNNNNKQLDISNSNVSNLYKSNNISNHKDISSGETDLYVQNTKRFKLDINDDSNYYTDNNSFYINTIKNKNKSSLNKIFNFSRTLQSSNFDNTKDNYINNHTKNSPNISNSNINIKKDYNNLLKENEYYKFDKNININNKSKKLYSIDNLNKERRISNSVSNKSIKVNTVYQNFNLIFFNK